MNRNELRSAVRNFKRNMNCDCKDKTYPSELIPTEESILSYCITECLDLEEYGLLCPSEYCPLRPVLESIVLSDAREGT